jgi:hypothetical protein
MTARRSTPTSPSSPRAWGRRSINSPAPMVENARRRADTIIEKAQQQVEQMRADVTTEAQNVLEQAREVAEQIRHEVEQERAAVVSETDQVREFRDGLLDDLGRVHGEISGLLERTRKQRDQALGADGAADPKATQNGKAKKPTEPTKVAEDKVADHHPPAKAKQGTCSGGWLGRSRLLRWPSPSVSGPAQQLSWR